MQATKKLAFTEVEVALGDEQGLKIITDFVTTDLIEDARVNAVT